MEDQTQVATRKKKRAATQTEIEKELKEIYGTEDIGRPEPIERIKAGGTWRTIIGITVGLFVVAGVIWGGVMAFGGSTRYGDRVKISIEGPNQVRSGEVQTWTVRYQNDERLPLARAQISLRLPKTVAIISAEPAASENNSTFNIGTISPHADGSIVIRGRVTDSVDAPIGIQGVLSYRPANFNSDFQKVTTWEGRVNDAVIEATLDAPEEAVPTEDALFKITVKRRADASADALLPALKVRFDPDHVLVVKKSTPAFANSDERSWSLPVPTDKDATLSASGVFAADANGDVPVRIEIGTLNDDGGFITLVPLVATVKVNEGAFVITAIRNGSAEPGTADFGATVHVSVDYENRSEKPITDAEISLNLSGYPDINGTTPIDWTTLSDSSKGKRDGNTITWNKKQVPELGLLNPGDKGSIDVSFNIIGASYTMNDRNYGVDISARGTIATLGGKKSGKTVATPVLQTLINSNSKLTSTAIYQGGVIPPKNGSSTTYKVVWTITNSLHEISGIKVSAQLPQDVSFVQNGNVAAGDLFYDESSRTVTWTLNRLPTSITSVGVDFMVALTPNAGDIGKTVPLMNVSTLTATDKSTNAVITRTDTALDSSIGDDPTYGGQGTVQP